MAKPDLIGPLLDSQGWKELKRILFDRQKQHHIEEHERAKDPLKNAAQLSEFYGRIEEIEWLLTEAFATGDPLE